MEENIAEWIEGACECRWDALVEEVVDDVSSQKDANLDGSEERCKTTWECYADLLWQNGPFTSMYEKELVDPACKRAIERLTKFESKIRLFHGLRKFQRHFLMFVEGRSKTFSLKYS